MFKNILICSFATKNNQHVIDASFEIAKKFDSNITLLKCIHKELPTFALFHTKSEKKKQKELTEEIQQVFDETEEMAKKNNIPLKTESSFVESLSGYVSTYVNQNNIDLFVADSTPPPDISMRDHKDIVNNIYKNIDCPVLTLK